MDDPSAELLERYRQGDVHAADELFARYVERLTTMVQWQIAPRLRRRLDPEDAVHSAYRSFFVKARQGEFVLHRSGDLWKLLVTITLNKLRRQIEHHRAGKRAVDLDRPLDDALTSRLAEGPSPLEALAAADELENFMAKLSPLQRSILEMRMRDCRWDEIATSTGCSERTARRTLEDVRRIWTRDLHADADRQVLREKKLFATIPRVREASLEGVGNIVGHDYRDYVLNEHIGSGGMGKVYRATQKSLDRVVAVKMLRKARWTLPGAVEHFLEEARVVAQLRHPGIVGVHGVGRTPGGGVFIVMDFIDGADLSKVLSASRPSPRQAIEWIAEAAAALDHAHRQGVIHCDLKPSNLLIDNTGHAIVSDFGLATTLSASAGSRQWAGTWGYMAPEQLDANFGEIGPATDVFALGLVLHQLLTRRIVFQGKRILEVLSQPDRDWSATWADPNVPPELGDVLAKCLAIEPAARYSSAQDLADALRDFITRTSGNAESRP